MTVGWRSVALGNVCKIDKSKASSHNLPLVGLEDIEGHTGRFLGTLEPRTAGSSTFHFGPQHVLYGRLRPYLNKVLVPEFEGHCSSEIFPLLPGNELNRKFLFYWLTSQEMVDAIDRTTTGARMPRADVKTLLSFSLNLPPLAEQRRIVAILDEAFAGIATATANAEKNLANARELFNESADLLLHQEVDEYEPLGVIGGRVLTGPFGSLLHKSDYIPGGIPLVNPAHIIDGKIVPDERKAVGSETVKRLAAYRLKVGDIVIGRRGEMGRCAVVGDREDGWLCGTGSFIIRPTGKADANYLSRLLRSKSIIRQLEDLSTGATMSNLSNRTLSDLPIALPNLDEQRWKIAELDRLEDWIASICGNYNERLSLLTSLKRSFLAKALLGEVTSADQAVAT